MTDMEKKQFSGIKTEKMPLISLWLLQMLIARKSLSKTLLELCRVNGENQTKSSIHGSLVMLLRKRLAFG